MGNRNATSLNIPDMRLTDDSCNGRWHAEISLAEAGRRRDCWESLEAVMDGCMLLISYPGNLSYTLPSAVMHLGSSCAASTCPTRYGFVLIDPMTFTCTRFLPFLLLYSLLANLAAKCSRVYTGLFNFATLLSTLAAWITPSDCSFGTLR